MNLFSDTFSVSTVRVRIGLCESGLTCTSSAQKKKRGMGSGSSSGLDYFFSSCASTAHISKVRFEPGFGFAIDTKDGELN